MDRKTLIRLLLEWNLTWPLSKSIMAILSRDAGALWDQGTPHVDIYTENVHIEIGL